MTAGLATPDAESWHNTLELLATELASELISKHELIDVEDDLDNIDEFVNETPYDQMMTEAMNNAQYFENYYITYANHT